jgi:hypothetical protein
MTSVATDAGPDPAPPTAMRDRWLIERHRDPADRRRLALALTVKGPRTARGVPAGRLGPAGRDAVRPDSDGVPTAQAGMAAKVAASPAWVSRWRPSTPRPQTRPPRSGRSSKRRWARSTRDRSAPNSVPATITLPNGHVQPFNPLNDVAFHALSSASSIGYLVCGLAALVAALIAAFVLGGRRHHSTFMEIE